MTVDERVQFSYDTTLAILRPLLGVLLQDREVLLHDEEEHRLVSKLYADLFHAGKSYASAEEVWRDVLHVGNDIVSRRMVHREPKP